MSQEAKERKRVAIFRPEGAIERTRKAVEQAGFAFFGFPVFKLVAKKEALQEIKNIFSASPSPVAKAVDFIVFTSANGVRFAFEICESEGGLDLRDLLSSAHIVAIGPATVQELNKRGVSADFVPQEFSSRGLVRLLTSVGVKGKKVLLLRSSAGSSSLRMQIEELGASVEDIAVYEPVLREDADAKRDFERLLEFEPEFAVFTSSLTFKSFLKLSRAFGVESDVLSMLNAAKIVAIGEPTASTVRDAGLEVSIIPEKSTIESILEAIKRYIESSRKDGNDG
ncbi:MAG: uroporphyrinogen-III synthase [Candidatus Methanospirare jalkutatii]|nr:uroporphyrinogen-III synthase [Candidatus Methanospirare jalkutatii]